ncbi:MAG TPA: hypothetical protein DCE48_10935 [Lachnospiraceae bacterium]|nr:hypothetical protein [Lachnospiraceae bacterium]
MSDLISRKALVNGLMENYEKCMTFHDLLSYIQEQPTAYDVDKVVKGLRARERNFTIGTGVLNGASIRAEVYSHAVEIVEGGGDV